MTEAAFFAAYLFALAGFYALLWHRTMARSSTLTVYQGWPKPPRVAPSYRAARVLAVARVLVAIGFFALVLLQLAGFLVGQFSALLAPLWPGLALRLEPGGIEVTLSPSGAAVWPIYGAFLGLFTLAAAFSRRSVAYPFLAFHIALALFCLGLDRLVPQAIEGKADVVGRVLTLTLGTVLASQSFFLIFATRSLRRLAMGLASVVVSAVAVASGAVAASVLAGALDGPALMLFLYVVPAYGIIAPHIAGLSFALDSGA